MHVSWKSGLGVENYHSIEKIQRSQPNGLILIIKAEKDQIFVGLDGLWMSF